MGEILGYYGGLSEYIPIPFADSEIPVLIIHVRSRIVDNEKEILNY